MFNISQNVSILIGIEVTFLLIDTYIKKNKERILIDYFSITDIAAYNILRRNCSNEHFIFSQTVFKT